MQRTLAVLAAIACFFAAFITSVHAAAIEIPISTVVKADEGSITLLASATTPPEYVGQTCVGTARAENQPSVHPNNDLIVASGGSAIVVPDVERAPNAVTTASSPLVLGPTVTVSLRMGPDERFSGGLVFTIDDCTVPTTTTTEPPTTTTTEPPPTTTTTEPPPTTTTSSTTTVPPSGPTPTTTTTTEPPPTTTTTEPPPTTTSTTEPPTTTTTDAPPPTLPETGVPFEQVRGTGFAGFAFVMAGVALLLLASGLGRRRFGDDLVPTGIELWLPLLPLGYDNATTEFSFDLYPLDPD